MRNIMTQLDTARHPAAAGNTMSRTKAAPALPEQTLDSEVPAQNHHTKAGLRFLKKRNRDSPHDSAISLLSTYPQNGKQVLKQPFVHKCSQQHYSQ